MKIRIIKDESIHLLSIMAGVITAILQVFLAIIITMKVIEKCLYWCCASRIHKMDRKHCVIWKINPCISLLFGKYIQVWKNIGSLFLHYSHVYFLSYINTLLNHITVIHLQLRCNRLRVAENTWRKDSQGSSETGISFEIQANSPDLLVKNIAGKFFIYFSDCVMQYSYIFRTWL